MGGCRCTYRDCKVRSDGVTHMFHYPVFDKVRCHQWLTNARKLEFLNLKLSQLKNRVVCQYHFKPSNFMNFKMDKLTHDAVPTENGPFCTEGDRFSDEDAPMDMFIALDDIDNDKLTSKDKKANLSVKYGDFLINSENEIFPRDSEKKKQRDPMNLSNQSFSYAEKSGNTLLVKENQNQSVVMAPLIVDTTIPSNKDSYTQVEVPSVADFNMKPVNQERKNKIVILSERKISDPVKVEFSQLEPVSPSVIINVDHKSKNIQHNVAKVETEKVINSLENMGLIFNNNENPVDVPPTIVDVPDLLQTTTEPVYVIDPITQNWKPQNVNILQLNQLNTHDKPQSFTNLQTIKPNTSDSSPVKLTYPISLLKNKLTPERAATIEEKRKFNKRLRDMIEFCLEELDENEKQSLQKIEQVKSNKSQKSSDYATIVDESVIKRLLAKRTAEEKQKLMENERKLQSELSPQRKESHEPSVADNKIAALETRLNKMEETLLKQIQQNSKSISDLRSSIEISEKKSVLTQTFTDEESCKKRLYQEISEFLSPETNSLIYEELFLNKFSKQPLKTLEDVTKIPKRRRYR